MLKSRISGGVSWLRFAPADLLIQLHPEYRDVRIESALTLQQREQKRRLLFLAKEVIDID